MAAFGTTLGLGTVGVQQGAAGQQTLEANRFKLAELARQEAEAQRAAQARAIMLGGVLAAGRPEDKAPWSTAAQPFIPPVEIPSTETGAAPTAGVSIPTPTPAAGYTAGAAQPITRGPAVPSISGNVPPRPTEAMKDLPYFTARAGIPPELLRQRQAAIEEWDKKYGATHLPTGEPKLARSPEQVFPPTGGLRAPLAKTVVDKLQEAAATPENQVAIARFRAAQDAATGIATPEQIMGSPAAAIATAPAGATPPVPANPIANYLSNPGIIPQEITYANEVRSRLVRQAQALYDSLQSGSDVYLSAYLQTQDKLDQMNAQMFLLGASQGIVNLDLGDTSLLSNVLTAARGVETNIVARPDGMFDVYFGGQLSGAGVSRDELQSFAMPAVNDAYMQAIQAKRAEAEAAIAMKQIEQQAELAKLQTQYRFDINKILTENELKLYIERYKIENTPEDITAFNATVGDNGVTKTIAIKKSAVGGEPRAFVLEQIVGLDKKPLSGRYEWKPIELSSLRSMPLVIGE
jgi:hypothetical protein